MTLALFAAGTMLVALLVYTLTGGADFGGGVWDLLARGPRAQAQRRVIERALAPVWEANHVWLIFAVVVLFTAFPPAFARLGVDLHVPLTVLLIGIVLRGSSFVFRHYGGGADERRWGRVFAVSSLVSPVCLGVVLGAITAGPAWWRPLPLAVGALALTAFAFLAAVYLCVEVEGDLEAVSETEDADPALARDFRRRAVASAAMVALAATAAGLCALASAPRFADRLFGSWWSVPLVGGAALAHAAAVVLVIKRRPRIARAAAAAAVSLLVIGWGLAQAPMLVAPDLTIAAAAAPAATLRVLVPVVVGGTALLVPSLLWLLRVFK